VAQLGRGHGAPGAFARRQHLQQPQVQGGPAEPRQAFQVGLVAPVDLLVAVAVRRQALERQQLLEPVDGGLVAPGDRAGQAGELRAGDAVPVQERDRAHLPQVGDHVLHEPDVGLVGNGRGSAGHRDGRVAPGRQQRHDGGPPAEAAVQASSSGGARDHPLRCRAGERGA
jgi:hypothetical protein